jgi:hypothetical protein
VSSNIHQLENIRLSEPGLSIPPAFKMSHADHFDCTTCHVPACRADRANTTFLRGGPYRNAIDFCFACHQKQAYPKLNPHRQILADGTLNRTGCLQCHSAVPDRETGEAAGLRSDMVTTCNKCHALTRHEQDHLGRTISGEYPAIQKTLRQSEQTFQLTFPLSPADEIQCNTCHVTHERTVLSPDGAVYAGSGENRWLLRIPKEKLCLACHDL